MDPNEEIILRKYLRRKIAVKNFSLSGMTSGFKEDAKILRNNIFTCFARGENGAYSATPSNINLMDIRDHIRNTGNKMSPYNYFDLDTLIAYNEYLEKILSSANLNRMKDRRQTFKISDFDTALKYTVPKYFIEHAGEFETGYYDLKCPVKIFRDERRRPIPERTPDAKSFDKKYPFSYCERLLNQYLEEKHPNVNSINNSSRESNQETERYDFIYKGQKYLINSEKYYLGEDNYTIRYISADSLDNRYRISGYFDLSMQEYIGNIYDMEQNFIADSAESGVDIFDNQDHNM